jgi:hypothetical protein
VKAARLKTAAECTAHGERTYTCINCGQTQTRKGCETWHGEQCDDCIVMWAYERAVVEADKAITEGAHPAVVKWQIENLERWRETVEKRGLLRRR